MRTATAVVMAANEITRTGITAMIDEAWSCITVQFAAGQLVLYQKLLRDLEVDVVVIDDSQVRMEEVIQLSDWCREQVPRVGMLLITRRRNPFYLRKFARYVYRGILAKEEVSASLLRLALQSVQGQIVFHSAIVFEVMQHEIVQRLGQHDGEEALRLLRLLEQGLTVKEIMRQMGIGRTTVYRMKTELLEAFGAANDLALLEQARRLGLLEGEESA